MITTERSGPKMLRLAVCREAGVDYLNESAALIRELPEVLRVRVDLTNFRLEVRHAHQEPGLLQQVHQALLAAGRDFAPARAH